MRRLAALVVLGVAVGWCTPAAGELRVLEEGYSVALIGTEWAHGGEQYFGGQPQADGMGNVYYIVGGAPGRRIVRTTRDRFTPFAELRDESNAYIMGLWFDAADSMIVLVQRAAPYGGDALERPRDPEQLVVWPRVSMGQERVFYRIRGFPTRAAYAPDRSRFGVTGGTYDRPLATLVGRISSGAPGGLLVLLMTATLAIMLRQLERDTADFWRHR